MVRERGATQPPQTALQPGVPHITPMRSSRPSRRALAAVLVLVTWAASLGWLGLRHLTRTESATLRTEAALRLAPGAAWFGLYNGNVLVGRAGITLDTLSPGYQVREAFALDLPHDSAIVRSTRSTTTTVTASLVVTRVQSRAVRAGWREGWLGTLRDNRLRFTQEGGDSDTTGLVLPSVPTTFAFLPFRLALSGGLVEGRSRTLLALSGWPASAVELAVTAGRDTFAIFADSSEFDPLTGIPRVAHMDSVSAREVTILADGPGERWWVDARGRVVGVETAFGLNWVRADFDLIAHALRDRSPQRAAALTKSYPAVMRLTRPDTASRTQRFLLSRRDGRSIDLELLSALGTGRQSISGDTVIVLPGAAVTAGRGEPAPLPFDPLADTTDTGIRALAERARAANPEKRPAMVLDLLRAINRAVVLDTSATAPLEAADVLRNGRGRAEGIARLFVAAATAAGIPARLAIGVRPVGDAFESHAWAEIRLQGFWTAVDPSFGRASAGTSLIRLSSSGSPDPSQLLTRIAQLRVTALPRTPEIP